LRAVVGVGGDGTAAALLNCTPPGVPITLLARGTENLLAKYYRLGTTPESVADTIASGQPLHLDVGTANGRLFILMASCGFDAEVVTRLHGRRRGHIHHLSYARPIFDALCTYNYPPLCIHLTLADGSEQTLHSRWFFAFNLPCYARGLPLASRSDACDGLLDVCTFSKGSVWHGLRYLAAVATGRHERLADCCTARVRNIRVESELPAPFQIDGDPGGTLPLEIGVLPGRMTLLAPVAPSGSQSALVELQREP
jgi:diacylglycerol kinase family enzyme